MVAKNMISGVICEFNPLHNGHAALLHHIRRKTEGAIVCIMSGNFVQRGEAAALDKWSRARLALETGADLVVELPLPWAMSGAERFALGGVFLLHALGCADTLWFGSECGDPEPLLKTAVYLSSPAFSSDVKKFLAMGFPFATARSKAIESALGNTFAAYNAQPNNILGIEYCKALLKLESNIKPCTIQRFHVEHDASQASGSFASASLLRKMSSDGQSITSFVPAKTANRIDILRAEKQYPADIQYLERAILGHLSTTTPEQLRNITDVSEGIENRICAAAGKVSTLDELYSTVKSKRYSHARIRRIVLGSYLGLTKDLPTFPPYIRILGMTGRGTEILRCANPIVPYIMRPADLKKLSSDAKHVFDLEVRADDLYALCTEQRRPAGLDYTEKLIRI